METELSVEIHNAIKNHTGHTVNLAVTIMSILRKQNLFIYDGSIRDIIEIDYQGAQDEYEGYTVYVETTEED